MKDLKREVKITELNKRVMQLEKDLEIASLKQLEKIQKNSIVIPATTTEVSKEN